MLGLIDHVTAMLALPVTVAVNCHVSPVASAAAEGDTDTDTGCARRGKANTETSSAPIRTKLRDSETVITDLIISDATVQAANTAKAAPTRMDDITKRASWTTIRSINYM